MRFIPAVLSLLLASQAGAQDVGNGAGLFQSRCAACHGGAARGDGPMASLLTIPVADLTGLADRNGGVFPRADVVRMIDGRLRLLGHDGGGPMPVFGPLLGGGSAVIDGPGGSVIETRGDVLDLAAYLETLQGSGD